MIPTVLMGLDPSFCHFGIALLNLAERELITGLCGNSVGQGRNAAGKFGWEFSAVYRSGQRVVSAFQEWIEALPGSVGIGSEIPPPLSNFSAGLYGLGFLTYAYLEASGRVDWVFTFQSGYMGHILHRRKTTLTEKRRTAYLLLEAFSQEFAYRGDPKKLTEDEVVALIILSRLTVRFLPDSLAAKSLLALEPNFQNEKEHLLF